jgi:hypothetical protein
VTTATAKTPKKADVPEAVEAAPKYATDSIEARALAKLRAHYRVEPGPLPPIGAQADNTIKQRAALIENASIAWANSGLREGYFTRSVVKDCEPLGLAVLAGMREVVERHGRVAVADAIGEQILLTGGARGQVLQNDERMSRVAGELISIQRRLDWLYEVLPKDVASFRPLPPGPVGRRLHARRLELIGMLDDAFAGSHIAQGRAAVDLLLQHAYPGTPAVLHSLNGWVACADAARNGAEFPGTFVEDWCGIVPAACAEFEEWPALAEWVLRVN